MESAPAVPSPSSTAEGEATAASSSAPSTPTSTLKTALPLPSHKSPLDTNLRSCFICLQNESETPNETWVNPCPCTLEAHEDCMLRWVAEIETQARGAGAKKGGLRCPACNARIRVDEPWDPVVRLRERLHRAYSRASPVVLLSFLLSGAWAASGYYGFTAAQVFAGANVPLRWVLGSASRVGGAGELGGAISPVQKYKLMTAMAMRITALSLVGPVLIIHRGFPFLGRLVSVPASILYGATLVAQDHMPTWPPSPEWAITLMPSVQLIYSHLYYDMFGDTERRLNRALRGLLEEPDAPARPQAQGQIAGGANNANGDGQGQPNEGEGLGQAMWQLGTALLGLFGDDDEVVLEVQVRQGAPGDEQDDNDHVVEEVIEVDEEEIEEALQQLERQVRQEEEEQQQQQEQAEEESTAARDDEVEGDEAAEPPSIPRARVPEPVDDAGPPANVAANPAEADAQPPQAAPRNAERQQDEGAATTTISDIVNSIVTSLLLPAFSAGIGELLLLTLPRSMTARPRGGPPPTGLLQQMWGRSLVGGCLFIVLKDSFKLYAKYRKVAVKKHRKIRNVKRRRPDAISGGASTGAPTTPST